MIIISGCLIWTAPNYSSLYGGEPARIHVDESVKPVAQPHRRVPFHVRKQVGENSNSLKMMASLNA